MNDIFTALENAQRGFITLEDLGKYWKMNEAGYDMFLMSQYGISSADVCNVRHFCRFALGRFGIVKLCAICNH